MSESMLDVLKRRAAAKEEAAVAAVHAWEGKLDADAAAKEADRVLVSAVRAAVDAGWSDADLRAIGIKLPESAKAKKAKPSRSFKSLSAGEQQREIESVPERVQSVASVVSSEPESDGDE